MSVLLTILNRADPTPTARSIVSQNISNVHILVLGYDMYTDEQKSGLRRFEKWSIGSARDEHFPKDKWLDDLDWISLEDRGVNLTFHHLNSVSEFDFDILVNGGDGRDCCCSSPSCSRHVQTRFCTRGRRDLPT